MGIPFPFVFLTVIHSRSLTVPVFLPYFRRIEDEGAAYRKQEFVDGSANDGRMGHRLVRGDDVGKKQRGQLHHASSGRPRVRW